MNRLALLLVLLGACGAVTTNAGDGAGLEGPDADAGAPPHDGGARDGGSCPAPTLFCTTIVRSTCPQGQAMASETVCGGAAFAVCCPVDDCEIVACKACPDCVL